MSRVDVGSVFAFPYPPGRTHWDGGLAVTVHINNAFRNGRGEFPVNFAFGFSRPTTSDAGIGEHSLRGHRGRAAGVHYMRHVLRPVQKATETQVDRRGRIVSIYGRFERDVYYL